MVQDEAKQSDFSATVQLGELGEVTVGVKRADGHKCARYAGHQPVAYMVFSL